MLSRKVRGVASSLCLLSFSIALVANIALNIIRMRSTRTVPNDGGGQMVLLERYAAATTAALVGQIAFWLGALALVWVIYQLPRPNTSLERTRER
jgi:hypothetical protein